MTKTVHSVLTVETDAELAFVAGLCPVRTAIAELEVAFLLQDVINPGWLNAFIVKGKTRRIRITMEAISRD